MRQRAEGVTDGKIRLAFLKIAESYEALADLADDLRQQKILVGAALAVDMRPRFLD